MKNPIPCRLFSLKRANGNPLNFSVVRYGSEVIATNMETKAVSSRKCETVTEAKKVMNNPALLVG